MELQNTKTRPLSVKITDWLLYLGTFGGIGFISGSLVHALQYSLFNVFLLVSGVTLTGGSIFLREKIFNPHTSSVSLEERMVSVITPVSAACVAGGILHWQEAPAFGLFLVLGGLTMSFISKLLYNTADYKRLVIDYLLGLAMFSGISFISGSVVHAMNSWFTNFSLIFIGLLLTPGAFVLRQKWEAKPGDGNLITNFLILVFVTMGVGATVGGIIHFTINATYSTALIASGLVISFIAAMFKNQGTLAELRK